MAELSDLFKVAPTTAGYMLGGQLAGQERTEDLKQQQMGLENQLKTQEYGFNEQNNPGRVQHQILQNKGLEAQLPGQVADSRGKVVAADIAEQTKTGSINATNTKNAHEVLKAKMDEGQLYDQFFTRALTDASQIPNPIMRQQYLMQLAQQYQMPMDNPQFQAMLQAGSKDVNALKALREMTQKKLAETSQQYIIEKMKADEHAKSAKEVAGIHAGATVKAAEVGASSRIEAAKLRQKQGADILDAYKAGKVPPDRAATSFETLATFETDPVLQKKYQELAYKFAQEAARLRTLTGVGKPDGAGLGIPTQQVPPTGLGQGEGGAPPKVPSGTKLPDGSIHIE